MIRNLLLSLMIAFTGATALAFANAGSLHPTNNPANVTVIEKNQYFPVIGPQAFEPCATEDCSDTQL